MYVIYIYIYTVCYVCHRVLICIHSHQSLQARTSATAGQAEMLGGDGTYVTT